MLIVYFFTDPIQLDKAFATPSLLHQMKFLLFAGGSYIRQKYPLSR
jgi:hypothetical protein